MPHLHQSTNHTFGFAVRLRSVTTGKFLSDVIFYAGFDKAVLSCSFVFFAVV